MIDPFAFILNAFCPPEPKQPEKWWTNDCELCGEHMDNTESLEEDVCDDCVKSILTDLKSILTDAFSEEELDWLENSGYIYLKLANGTLRGMNVPLCAPEFIKKSIFNNCRRGVPACAPANAETKEKDKIMDKSKDDCTQREINICLKYPARPMSFEEKDECAAEIHKEAHHER